MLTSALEDREISLVLDTIFPRSMYLDFIPGIDEEEEDRRLVPSPYGDCFDVLLSNVSMEVLLSYPAAIFLGPQRFPQPVIETLSRYLQAGGTVYLTHHQADQLGATLTEWQEKGQVICYGLSKADIPQ